MTESDSPSSAPDKTETKKTETPVKRPRGRPRKTPVTDAGEEKTRKPAAKKAAPKKTAAATKTTAAKSVKRVPRDQPIEWVVPRGDEEEAETRRPSSSRATSVRPLDAETVHHPSDAFDDDRSDEISEEEIRARREAARAVVADIGRMKKDVQSMNSYIAAPPKQDDAAPVAPADAPEESAPLSRREYWKQRRQERYLQRQQRRQSGQSASVAPESGSRTPNRNDRTRPRPNPRNRPEAPRGEAQAAPAELLPPLKVTDLQALSAETLLGMADEQGVNETLASPAKHDVVFALLRNYVTRGGSVVGEGVLEIVQEGHGYLRNPWNSFRSCPEDAMVPLQIVRRFGLRAGDQVSGVTRPPTRDQRERRFVVVDVVLINGVEPATVERAPFFDSLEVVHPSRAMRLETAADEPEMRVVDLFMPIGFGQRGLVLAPPRTGRRVILRKLASAIAHNHPNAEVMIVLVDERPEEISAMARKTEATVLGSSFEESPVGHVQTAEVVLDLARRRVERGADVVVLLDSLTRLTKAYHAIESKSGRIQQSGVDVVALNKAKRLFGAARAFEDGGSLTLIATISVGTGFSTDEIIVEEFLDSANMTLWLDRQLAQKRIFPPIDLARSETRHASELMGPETLDAVLALRKTVEGETPETAMQAVLARMSRTADNTELLAGVKV